MAAWKITLLYGYFAVLAVLSVYGAHRYVLLFLFYRHRHRVPQAPSAWEDLPPVTIQLPMFNEATVVERLLEAVANLDYPKELVEIQVLDDSTDETTEIAKRKVAELVERGWNAVHLHRENRNGFKAGALAEGLRCTDNEFVAVFDADFVPDPGFLKQTIHHFTDPEVGMVQVRWGHLNKDFSLLTRLQSMFLDGHFVIEHTARNRSGRHFNFNGTAGIWRVRAIQEAGGWQHDTLTEDLDLSYRAQLHGWRFVYLTDVTAPAELPVEMNAFKSQQHRWAKGSIQTSRKLLPRLWTSSLPWKIKLEATFHLTANCAYPLLLLMCLLMLPALLVRLEDPSRFRNLVFDASVFVLATCSVWAFYIAAEREVNRRWKDSLKFLPGLTSLGVGLAVNNARAVLEALLAHDSPFVRTPKYNANNRGDGQRRYQIRAHWLSWLELGFAVYLTIILGVAVYHQLWVLSVFLVMFAGGFWSVGIASLAGRSGAPAWKSAA